MKHRFSRWNQGATAPFFCNACCVLSAVQQQARLDQQMLGILPHNPYTVRAQGVHSPYTGSVRCVIALL
ncbi:hypothetical protein SAMN05421772_101281 [Paracoccus saliphilus]|uniref:Uncharacterized protein n=1 Tax=Paracoccus saliphilus TaxID=405559 RepID=A0AA45W0Z3_9RHOB|nr:hypothetical protein SAMN05421772_101281 [Paracoccus saliphilus]